MFARKERGGGGKAEHPHLSGNQHPLAIPQPTN